MNVLVQHQNNADQHISTIIPRGTISIDMLNGLRKLLMKEIGEYHVVRISTEQIESLDVSFLQLLASANRYASDAGKTFEVKNPCRDNPFTELCVLTGFCPPNGAEYSSSGSSPFSVQGE